MKKILALVVIALVAISVLPSSSAQSRRDVMLFLDKIDHPASLKQFKKATPQCQLENLLSLLEEAEETYYSITKVDDLYELDVKMDVLAQYIRISKESHSSVESKFKLLSRKITRSIVTAEDGISVEPIRGAIRGDRGNDY